MPATNWKEHFEILVNDYAPLATGDGKPKYPNMGVALDDGIDKLLAEFVAGGSSDVNKRFVEDLLSDCVARVSNALILREKANEVEVRAVQEAMNHSYQVKLIETTQEIGDLLGPIQGQTGVNATGLTADGEGFKFVGNEAVWKNVKKLQDGILASQTELLDAALAKAMAPGNGANYVERFTMLKDLFDLGMPELYGRCLACAAALKKIYHIEVPVPKVSTTGYLNRLAIWAQNASDRLDVELGKRYTGDVMFAIAAIDENLRDGELLPRSKYTLAVQTGMLNFSIAETQFERFKMAKPLLRSVHIHVRPKTEDGRTRIWAGTVSPPDSDLTLGDEDFPCLVTSVYAQSEGETVYGVHNLNPIGDWTLRLASPGVTGDALNGDEVLNVFIRMRVSYQRKGT